MSEQPDPSPIESGRGTPLVALGVAGRLPVAGPTEAVAGIPRLAS